MSKAPSLYLGAGARLDRAGGLSPLELPAHHLVTHGAILGMTGSGKTGLLTVLVEEALLARVPVLMIDVKGDLPNLLLPYTTLSADLLLPWVESTMSPHDTRTPMEVAAELAAQRAHGLGQWSLGEAELKSYAGGMAPGGLTPG